MTSRTEQAREFIERTDYRGAQLEPLQGDASFRRYIRVRKDGQAAMLMDAPPDKENIQPYVTIAEYMYRKGYSAPAILAQDMASGFLLLEDLGSDSFTLLLAAAQAGQREVLEHELYAHAIDLLAEWHDNKRPFASPQGLLLPAYDHGLLMREVSLFADWYLPQVLGKDMAASLRGEYMSLWENILAAAPLSMECFVHRDYHADNLMWLPSRAGTKRVGLLDFQDGVYGDAAYDMVSLLEDARRDVPLPLVEKMLERYIVAAGVDKTRFMTAYGILAAQRNSKIIGIFARLAARDNKFAYLNYLPRVWRHLENDLAHPSLSSLKSWLDRHVSPEGRGVITLRHTSQELLSA